jgi:DNA-binding beta-propeller fold protein YncE
MKRSYFIFVLGALIWAGDAQGSEPLRLLQTIPMPSIEGRIDHLAVDIKRERLFVAALGNNTIEVVPLAGAAPIKSLKGFREPQGVVYIPEFNRVFVASGGDGTCKAFEADTFHLVETLRFSGDADNVRYDSDAKQVYIGYGDGALAVADAASGRIIGDIKLEGHPESFQMEKSGSRIFVNVPSGSHIAVIDRHRRTVLSKWPLPDVQKNFPMALDEEHRRLFVGCRQPPCVVVFDMTSGKAVANLPIAGDTDDLFYDSENQRIYASCGEGFISVLEQRDADHYEATAKIPTLARARTSLFVPTLKRFYLAVPKQSSRNADLRVYEVRGRQD